jgi:hypothetical protein
MFRHFVSGILDIECYCYYHYYYSLLLQLPLLLLLLPLLLLALVLLTLLLVPQQPLLFLLLLPQPPSSPQMESSYDHKLFVNHYSTKRTVICNTLRILSTAKEQEFEDVSNVLYQLEKIPCIRINFSLLLRRHENVKICFIVCLLVRAEILFLFIIPSACFSRLYANLYHAICLYLA